MRWFTLLIASAGLGFGAVSFEPNLGQAPAEVRFLARAHGFVVAAEAGGLRLRSRSGDVRIRFAGSRGEADIAGEQILPAKMNYLRGSDGAGSITGIPTYARLRYRDLYPGIDLVCHGARDLEYDFVLAPGSAVSAIRMEFPGVEKIDIEHGALVLESAGRRIVQQAPTIYQDAAGSRRMVAGRYARRGRGIGFRVGTYDHSLPLVIDPTLVYSTYVMAFGYQDQGSGVALDTNGNAYVVGSTVDYNYGDQDIFIEEFDPTGTMLLNATALQGTYDDLGNAIAVDAAGNVYVTGYTSSPDLPITNSAYQHSLHGRANAYVAVIKPDFKNLVFASYLGGSTTDEAFGIAADGSGNTWVTGATVSTDFPTSSSSSQRSKAAGVDAFLAKFNSSGGLVYSTYFGGNGDDLANGIAVDASGNVYIAGSTISTNLPVTGGVLQRSNAGKTDAFTAKFSSSGTLVYATYFGGSGDDSAAAVAADAAGNAYIVGTTTSTNLPTTSSGFQPGSGGGQDAFVAKLNPTGTALIWGTYLGGSGNDSADAVAVDGGGNVYVTGSTASGDLPLTSDAYQISSGKSTVVYLSELSADGGSLLYGTMLGGSGGDAASGIAVSCSAGVFVTGSTASGDFPVTAGAPVGQLPGAEAAFVARFAGAGGTPAINSNGVVNGANFAVGPVAPGSLISIMGTNFTGQTASAKGSTLPTTLGGVSVTVNGVNAPLVSVSPGQINAELPWETQAGTAQVVVNGCGQSAPMAITVAASAPAIFQDANGHATVMNQDGTVNSATNPAKAGSVVTVLLTGIGAVTNQPADGVAAGSNPLSAATLGYAASIGGTPAPVQSLALQPGSAVVAQAAVMVPGAGSGDLPLVISVGGVGSTPATISVAP